MKPARRSRDVCNTCAMCATCVQQARSVREQFLTLMLCIATPHTDASVCKQEKHRV